MLGLPLLLQQFAAAKGIAATTVDTPLK